MACCHEADTSCRDRAGGATNQAPMSPSQLFPEAVLPQGDTDADRQGHEERAQQGSAFLHTRTLAVCIFLLGVLTSARAPCWSVAIGPQHSSPAGAPPSVSPQLRRPHTLAARGTNVHCAPTAEPGAGSRGDGRSSRGQDLRTEGGGVGGWNGKANGLEG